MVIQLLLELVDLFLSPVNDALRTLACSCFIMQGCYRHHEYFHLFPFIAKAIL